MFFSFSLYTYLYYYVILYSYICYVVSYTHNICVVLCLSFLLQELENIAKQAAGMATPKAAMGQARGQQMPRLQKNLL